MHVHEAVLAGSTEGILVLAGGAVATAAGTALGLRRLDYERIPQVAILSSAFFVVSLIHFPLVGVSVHLVLNGLVGLILGWAAFPALLVALLLQAVLLGHGGPLALGVNTLTMALPAVVCHYVFGRMARSGHEPTSVAAGVAAGVTAVLLAGVLTASALWAAGREFEVFAGAALGFYVAVAVVEGAVTAGVVVFLRKVRPELLKAPFLVPRHSAELPDA
ncbi:MAG: cobalt transporter CbiM [Planctomycetota bacterium]